MSVISPAPSIIPVLSQYYQHLTMANTESEVSLAHLSWLCPGMHGKESRQTIVRKTFRQLFQSEKRLIIPLIQRRYCWNQTTLWRWFEVRRLTAVSHHNILPPPGCGARPARPSGCSQHGQRRPEDLPARGRLHSGGRSAENHHSHAAPGRTQAGTEWRGGSCDEPLIVGMKCGGWR